MGTGFSHDEAREAAIRWAADLASDPRTVYLDTETTGFGRLAEIVDIAIVDVAGNTLLDRLVRPEDVIPPDASAIHGIYWTDVAEEPGWPEIHDEVMELLSGRPVVIYNSPYDVGIMRHCCDRHDLGWRQEIAQWECAMRWFAQYQGIRDPRRGGWKWHKLDIAVQRFGAQPGGHRALGDALACRQVVLGMAGLALR
ncbi:MAG: 3'-5' exonuclease [Thermomicrobiales bacterium]